MDFAKLFILYFRQNKRNMNLCEIRNTYVEWQKKTHIDDDPYFSFLTPVLEFRWCFPEFLTLFLQRGFLFYVIISSLTQAASFLQSSIY